MSGARDPEVFADGDTRRPKSHPKPDVFGQGDTEICSSFAAPLGLAETNGSRAPHRADRRQAGPPRRPRETPGSPGRVCRDRRAVPSRTDHTGRAAPRRNAAPKPFEKQERPGSAGPTRAATWRVETGAD
jgi:hypothetical protein